MQNSCRHQKFTADLLSVISHSRHKTLELNGKCHPLSPRKRWSKVTTVLWISTIIVLMRKSYLSNQLIPETVNGHLSVFQSINAAVPQTSILLIFFLSLQIVTTTADCTLHYNVHTKPTFNFWTIRTSIARFITLSFLEWSLFKKKKRIILKSSERALFMGTSVFTLKCVRAKTNSFVRGRQPELVLADGPA